MGIAGTTPHLIKFVMRNSSNLNDIWSEVTMAISLRLCDYDLESNWAIASTPMAGPSTTEVSRLSLPLCIGESDEIIDDYWIHAKRK
jgi:hypothetical protein